MPEMQGVRRPRVWPVLAIAAALALAAAYVVPRGIEARNTLAIKDDPARLATRALDGKFNAHVAARGIKQALANNDADLANSFVELADARHVPIDP
ncbi:MAG: hypothetical protein P8Y71_20665, partial [Pseudolabrys sp.]